MLLIVLHMGSWVVFTFSLPPKLQQHLHVFFINRLADMNSCRIIIATPLCRNQRLLQRHKTLPQSHNRSMEWKES